MIMKILTSDGRYYTAPFYATVRMQSIFKIWTMYIFIPFKELKKYDQVAAQTQKVMF